MSASKEQKNIRNRFVAGGLLGFVVFYLLSMILRSFGNDLAWTSTVLLIASILSIVGLIVAGAGLVFYLWAARRK